VFLVCVTELVVITCDGMLQLQGRLGIVHLESYKTSPEPDILFVDSDQPSYLSPNRAFPTLVCVITSKHAVLCLTMLGVI
jgi:hypothetical protein